MGRLQLPNVQLPFDVDALLARRWVRITLYAVFFVFCFLLFAYWSFPYHRLRDYIIRQVEHPAGSGGRQASGWKLDIVDLSPSWGTGVTLSGVQLARVPDDPNETAVPMSIEELTVRMSPLALLFGTTGASFAAEMGGGEMDGSFAHSEERTAVEGDVENVDLGQVRAAQAFLGIPIAGVMGGRLDFTIAEDPQDTNGELELSVAGLEIGNSRAKLKVEGMSDGLTIERIDAGDLSMRIVAEEGVARITELQSEGKDATLRGTGTIRLLKPLEMSRLDTVFRISFQDGYRNRSDQTRALFSLMEFNPEMRAARTPDDALQWRVSGSFGGRMTPAPAGKTKLPD
ncbi:MAG: type II secretion system protein GspN [Myxococcota bacterium]